MSTSPLETIAPSRIHAQTRSTRIQARSKAQGQGTPPTPPTLPLISPTTTITTGRVPWATTAPGGGSGATRAPWAAAMPMGTVVDSSGPGPSPKSGSGLGSMGPPRLPEMDIGGRGRKDGCQ
ncbi:hypothetical protein PILCRDRAFT_16585 [Piloderma croceum F 1598]|uniref:Uncharacterized protein n=1 Tax=Piloderma croceum (strain F 1598) TaxID=765440 RepID=A0A0C3EVA3_PILCF|nr:hypothetical protein PILCRDRAFT_16585 [Piloderma croceum F 1598]